MAKNPLKICLLGLGRAGNFHLQSLRITDQATVTHVFDVDSDRCQAVAQHQGCQAVRTAEEGIEHPEVDAVIVATPTDAHFEFVQRSIAANKPVLTEKPLGRYLQQIDTCFEHAKQSGVPLFVAFQRRFDPSFSSLVAAVHGGEVGQLQFVRSVSRDNPVPSPDYIRISGGIFHDCMVHDLDMVSKIVGQVPTHMSAFAHSFISEIGAFDDFDSVAAMLAFPGGVTASIDINRRSVYGYDHRIEAFGNGGMVTAENRHTTTVTRASEAGFARPPVDYSFPTRYRDAYVAELEAFVDCARGEREVPITHEDVRINHLLASGLETAAREHRVVPFSEIEPSLKKSELG